ncbi:hypothetical protein BaRGS_00029455 [Batillaria attramentaria]|uniref:Uncharacterized protein n=1 Tax=Batillaria attramentaria TaxID=370345 RepID=A0ABD0JW27_9CAEN
MILASSGKPRANSTSSWWMETVCSHLSPGTNKSQERPLARSSSNGMSRGGPSDPQHNHRLEGILFPNMILRANSSCRGDSRVTCSYCFQCAESQCKKNAADMHASCCGMQCKGPGVMCDMQLSDTRYVEVGTSHAAGGRHGH